MEEERQLEETRYMLEVFRELMAFVSTLSRDDSVRYAKMYTDALVELHKERGENSIDREELINLRSRIRNEFITKN